MRDAIKKLKPEKSQYEDSRIKKLENGDIIRFLPAPDDAVPLVRFFTHGVQRNGRWLVCRCPATVFRKCPVCEHAAHLHNRDWELARRFAKRSNYVSNMVVLSDRNTPQNNGKVFLAQFGTQLFDIYDKACERALPCDPMNGSNLRVILGTKNGFPNYEKCFFESPSVLFDGNDERMTAALDAAYELDEFIAENAFPSYLGLSNKLQEFLGTEYTIPSAPPPEPSKSAAAPTEPSTNPPKAEALDEGEDFFERMSAV
ncbi:MAG TPA: hypothetical protein VGN17_26195 [Bryobacteraceae bacterium]|jgi:hypothetical protein